MTLHRFPRWPPALRAPGRGLAKAAAAGAAVLAALVIDATLVEPYWIQVTRHRVEAPVEEKLTLALISDLHTRAVGRRERSLLRILEREKPDLILIAGDSLSTYGGTGADAAQTIAQMRAPHGVWWVRGNWDHRDRAGDAVTFEAAGAHVIVNEAWPAHGNVWIAGFDDVRLGDPTDEPLRAFPEGAYRIALFHSPAFFDQIAGRVDLALAGHTHGGQVRLPFLPALWTPPGSGSYVEGWYEKDGSRMYVTRGIGTSTVPVRLFCRPEVAILTLDPQVRQR